MIKLGNLIVSDEDLAIIAHVVHNETPEEWATRVFNYSRGGVAAIKEKISKYRVSYTATKDAIGYKTAMQRETDRHSADQAALAKARANAETRKVADEAALDARITAEVTRQLATRPFA